MCPAITFCSALPGDGHRSHHATPHPVTLSGFDGCLWWSLLETPDDSTGIADIVACYRDNPRNQQQLHWALLRFAADMTSTQAALNKPTTHPRNTMAQLAFDQRVPLLHTWLDHTGISIADSTSTESGQGRAFTDGGADIIARSLGAAPGESGH